MTPSTFRTGSISKRLALTLAGLLLAGCAPAASPSPPATAAPAKSIEAAAKATVVGGAPSAPAVGSPTAQPSPAATVGPLSAASAVSTTNLDQLYERAKQEGTVLWYTTFPLDEATPVGEAFTAKYPGVKVEIFRGTGTTVVQRFETEYQAGQARADVVQIANMDPVLKWAENGWLMHTSLPSSAGIPERWKQEGQWYMEAVVVSCMGYNTQAIPPAEAPNSFEALADPKYRGKVATIPPWATGSGLEHAYYMQVRKGIADWPARLASNKPLLFNTSAELAQALGRGEVVLGAPLNEYDVLRFKRQGAPIECIFPKDEVAMTVRPVTIPKNAPHPNAAQLFLNWRLSDEGQKLMQDQIGYRSVRQGFPSPAGLPPTDLLNLFLPDAADIAKQREVLNQAWEQYFR